jgi:hypothetical protein
MMITESLPAVGFLADLQRGELMLVVLLQMAYWRCLDEQSVQALATIAVGGGVLG